MAVRLTPGDPAEVEAALLRLDDGTAARADLRLLTKHFLALLSRKAPGSAVEVRVPPYAAVQVVGGTVHRRGTPPAVVELAPATWVDLARGRLTWSDAVSAGLVLASGERSDLSPHLPL